MRVLAIGECMAELAPADIAGAYRLGFAGDTFNTAWYLARLMPEVSVSYFTALGVDTISQDMRAFMQSSGIDDRHVRTVSDRTVGLYLISLTNGDRSFSYWRGQSAARLLANDPDALQTALADADLIYFSGITLAILDANDRAQLVEALRGARAAGKTIAFDPNLRPKLWSSPTEMTESIMEGASVSDIALPSFEDEARWFRDTAPETTAKRYGGAGALTVVVKNGANPVHFLERGALDQFAVDPLPDVVDTTAAGDSFNAGLFAGHAAGLSLRDGIGLACRLARQVVQHKGALVPFDLSKHVA
ncbi:MAG: sugar kinase [Pseudomonadota bacterium]